MSTNGKVSENQFQFHPRQLKKKQKCGGTVNYPQRLANLHVLLSASLSTRAYHELASHDWRTENLVMFQKKGTRNSTLFVFGVI